MVWDVQRNTKAENGEAAGNNALEAPGIGGTKQKEKELNRKSH